MAEPVGDLVVDLSLDAARFDEQMAIFPVRKVMRKKQRQSLNSR